MEAGKAMSSRGRAWDPDGADVGCVANGQEDVGGAAGVRSGGAGSPPPGAFSSARPHIASATVAISR
jgi:hypothetical protein